MRGLIEIDVPEVALNQVIAELKLLSETEKNRALTKGISKGGHLILSKEKSELKKSMKSPMGVTGNLMQSFQLKIKRYNSGFVVGSDQRGSHSHLVDRGHEIVVGGVYTGKETRALMFREKTIDQYMSQARQEVIDGIKDMISKYTN